MPPGVGPARGAPTGNLNALHHGRRSRFPDLMPSNTDAVTVAGRLLAKERRVAERHATTLLRLALIARHWHDYVAPIEEGRPLPRPPVLDISDVDIASLMRYMRRVGQRAAQECALRDGTLTRDAPAVASARVLAEHLDDLVRLAAAELARAGHSRCPARTGPNRHIPSIVQSTNGRRRGFGGCSGGARSESGTCGNRKFIQSNARCRAPG